MRGARRCKSFRHPYHQKENPVSKKIYLCGPISGRSDAECNNWRQMAAKMWAAYGGTSLDPMVRDARGKDYEPGIERIIVEADKADIRSCAAVLVYYFMPTVGTSMEILYAYMLGIPVVVVNASMHPEQELSLWIRYHASFIVEDLTTAMHRLDSLQSHRATESLQ